PGVALIGPVRIERRVLLLGRLAVVRRHDAHDVASLHRMMLLRRHERNALTGSLDLARRDPRPLRGPDAVGVEPDAVADPSRLRAPIAEGESHGPRRMAGHEPDRRAQNAA